MLKNANFRDGPPYFDMDVGEEITPQVTVDRPTRITIEQTGYDGPEGIMGDWMGKAWARLKVGQSALRISLGEVRCAEGLRIGLDMIRAYSTDPWREKRQNEMWKLARDARIFVCDARQPLVPQGSHVFPVLAGNAWSWDGVFYNRYARKTRWDLTPLHAGVDIVSPVGTQSVLAAHAGEVFFVGGYKIADEEGSEGIGVFVRGDDNVCYLYFHLDSLSASVEPGTRLETGEVIGVSGNSGFEQTDEKPHLHFGMYLPREVKERDHCDNIWEWDSRYDGFVINPEPYLIEWHAG